MNKDGTHSDPDSGRRYESFGSLKAYLVDTSARILFFVPAIGVWEKLAAQMENEEVLRSRAGAVLINLIAGRLHGKIREIVGFVSRTSNGSSAFRIGFADTISGLIVGVITYTPILYLSGASLGESVVALPFGLLFTAFGGWPYGKFLDWHRARWGTTPVFRSKEMS